MILLFIRLSLFGCLFGCVFGSSLYTFNQIAQKRNLYDLPPLPYSYSELEPYINLATVAAHHGGHHAAYTANLNKALTEWRQADYSNKLAEASILELLRKIDQVPEIHRNAIKNNGGGFVNHAIYFSCMSPNMENADRLPTGKLLEDIKQAFGSYESFREQFSRLAKAVFGSGYVWLSRKSDTYLTLTTSANQDSPISDRLNPILVLDVWEHAYYLKYQYNRPDYIESWWRLVDWDSVVELDHWWTMNTKDEL